VEGLAESGGIFMLWAPRRPRLAPDPTVVGTRQRSRPCVRCRAGAAITEAGDTCRELLLLIEGSARIEMRSENTIVAESPGTRVLSVPVDGFDTALERDPPAATHHAPHGKQPCLT
jgi:hypothetical protein